MARLLLVRHGKTVLSGAGKYYGKQDVKLSAEGIEQAEKLRDYLAEWQIDRIYTSSLSRAIDTAEIVAADRGKEITQYAMIDEMVADTPHATLEFDDMNNTSTITTDSVSAAEDLINDGLLADLSLLDDDVTVTISFGNNIEATTSSIESSMAGDQWTERNDWGRPVIFTVDTLLY